MPYELRPYQIEFCKNLIKSISQGHKNILFCLSAGSGKTVIMTDFAMRVANIKKKTMIVVDRLELLRQTISKIDKDFNYGWLTSDSFKDGDIVVCMLQTLRARLKQEKYQEWLESFDFIFGDEIHQWCNNGTTFKMILDMKKNDCVFLGCTATPFDMKGYLLEGFDDFVKGADVYDLTQLGYLVPAETFVADLFNFDNVKISKITGDYDTNAIDEIVVNTDKMDKVLDIWKPYQKCRTMAYCSSVKIAEDYCNFFKLNGIKAEVASAKTTQNERDRILNALRDKKIDIVFNVALYVAGLDIPELDCILLLAPTKLLRRYIQICTRALRICPKKGKEKAYILDVVGNSFRHLEIASIRSYQFAPKKKIQEEDFDEIQCPICGYVFPISENVCPECGFQLEMEDEEGQRVSKPKNKKEFEKLIKLKSIQEELHDTIFQFANLPCLIRTEEREDIIGKKWCYGYRNDGSPIFKTDKDYNAIQYPYPLIKNAKKTNCWYVFHTICTKYKPNVSALKYYGGKLRKATRFLEQIKNPNNKAFVNLYKLLD